MRSEDGDTAAWVRRFHDATGSPARLVCFPHAGGSASFFHPVSARFSPGTEVVALQYPGRQDRRREACIDDLGKLADEIAGRLATLSAKPTVFFGHSMGAVLAFETAYRLEQAGTNAPATVVASGRRAPSTRREDRVHERDDAGLIAELRLLNGTDSAVFGDDELLQLALPSIRGDYTAIETYRCEPGRRIAAPIAVLTGDADPKTTLAEAEAWREHTEGTFTVRVFAGGHFFLADHQADVNAEIAKHLGAVA
ncbi:alpha/beta fold hydrolase [Amycolatopsis sp., V23-08]|uniref:Alpha/beta fold hydrolase n=1 Tax=Amycolatopsis heterodermiae TaxID=3110235 RepID=A0ABU5R4H3_9PSEU|nr:alpha/beta fold hydrolase [Amycolatopsis sp., V23-08]MEA5361107.1 alpha/beta fold hydrolase [Amycolatopsis sp., V23-08]